MLFFVDDIIVGVGLRIFDGGYRTRGANSTSQFFGSRFVGN